METVLGMADFYRGSVIRLADGAFSNRCGRTGAWLLSWFAQGSLRKPFRAGIPPGGLMAVFAAPF